MKRSCNTDEGLVNKIIGDIHGNNGI